MSVFWIFASILFTSKTIARALIWSSSWSIILLLLHSSQVVEITNVLLSMYETYVMQWTKLFTLFTFSPTNIHHLCNYVMI